MAWAEHLVIGLTGGIGCGKTTVSKLFTALGARIIDTDEIAHNLSHPPSPALQQIAEYFGPEYLTPSGEMNRDKMRERVFSNPEERRILEHIFHPLIRQECLAQINRSTSSPYTLLAVPLLFEHNVFTNLIQRSLVIDCSEAQQIDRVMARSHLDKAQVLAIMASQISRDRRLELADDVICNDNTPDKLEAQVRELHQKYTTRIKDAH